MNYFFIQYYAFILYSNLSPNTIRLNIHDTEMAAASVLVKGAKLWNNLNTSYKTITTRNNFRTKIKSDMINLYSDV